MLNDWSRLTRRERAAIFVPTDTSLQEVRDCFHEELAQFSPAERSLSSDRFRLQRRQFNAVLTPSITLMSIHYAPDLHSGMTEAEVRFPLARGSLAWLNPAGIGQLPTVAPSARMNGPEAVEATFGPKGGKHRAVAAQRMLGHRARSGRHDVRLGLALYAVGALSAWALAIRRPPLCLR